MSDGPDTDRFLFKNGTADELHARLGPLGITPHAARRVQSAVMRGNLTEAPAELHGVARDKLERVRQVTVVPRLTLLDRVVSSADGFTRYLFRGEGDEPFETVRIPLLHRPGDEKYVICVSSQVGCALACAFCATGRMGFKRNLAVWEMVDQVLAIQADSPHPVRGVVFMGMGEPMLNYERVMKAAEVLNEPCGPAIDARAITVSTAGVVPGIRRFTTEKRPYRLIVSLTSADPERRRELMPIENTYPLPELMAAVREYHEATGRRVTLAWTMLSGINTRPEDARQIAELTAGMPVQLDIIDVCDSTGHFLPPSEQELNDFRDSLRIHLGMPVVRRYSGGKDINGGCGMLAGQARNGAAGGDHKGPGGSIASLP
jgi:23S rRNA (adenine2503-C2)-methyltransferase